MKILVTGGAGFIGSNFIVNLLKKRPSYEIINMDTLTYAGNLLNLREVEDNPNYKFIKGDICDPDAVTKAMGRCEAVVNFAAESHVDRSIHYPDLFLKTNILGAHCLLEVAKKLNIKKFIQIGTDEVYGSLSLRDSSSKETDTIKPNSPYSASKAAADMLARSYFTTYGLPVIILRSSNNFGYRQHCEKFIPRCITNLLLGRKAPLMGDGSNIRDWLFVKDNCDAIDIVLHGGKNGEIYNIGGNCEKTNKEVLLTILEYLGKDESHINIIPHRLGHDFRYSINCDKIKDIGWQPKIYFNRYIAETIEWYNTNRDYWIQNMEKQFIK